MSHGLRSNLMRIAHVISSLGFGGAEHLLYQRLKHSRNEKFDHVVITLRPGYIVEKIRGLGIPVYVTNGLIRRYDPVAYYRVKKIIKKYNPDLIHASLWSATMISRLIGKSLHIPVINDLHGNCAHHGWFRNWCESRTAHLSRSIICVSESVKESCNNHIVGAMSFSKKQDMHNRLRVIKNGIDIHALQNSIRENPLQRKDFGLLETDFVIGSVGRLKAIKVYDVLIRAFGVVCKKVSNYALLRYTAFGATQDELRWTKDDDVNSRPFILSAPRSLSVGECIEGVRPEKRSPKLLIIGGGPEEQSLKKLVQKLNLQNNVIFTGARKDAHRFYPLFDCFALSSKSEGISLALLEAMACGVPVVTTHNSKNHEVIEHEKSGLLVPVDDAKALANALEEIIINNKMARQRAVAGQKLVLEKFSIDRMVGEYERVYRSFS